MVKGSDYKMIYFVFVYVVLLEGRICVLKFLKIQL